MTQAGLSPEIVAVLRAADRSMLRAERGDVYALYAAVRVAMQSIAPLDSFYVAWIRVVERVTALPYTFERGRAQTTEVLPYGERGLTNWMLMSRRTYRLADDNGALIGAGYDFGGESESRDAVVTPIFSGESGEVEGFFAMLSYKANVFSDEHVSAFEWLATAFSIARDDSRPSPRRAHLLKVYPELDSEAISGTADVANLLSGRLHEIRAELCDLEARLERDDRLLVARLAEECLRLAARSSELYESSTPSRPDPAAAKWAQLTPRERDVAVLLCRRDGHLSNREIGQLLMMGETTVKTHVARILRKVGVRQRGEVRWVLG